MTADERRDAPSEDDGADVADRMADFANELQTVAGELEAAADRKDYAAIDGKFVEARSLLEQLDDAHDDLPAVPEVA